MGMNDLGDNGCAVSAASGNINKTNNTLGRTGRDRDFLHVAEGGKAFRGAKQRMHWERARKAVMTEPAIQGEEPFASYVSPVIMCRFPARQFLPSWNIVTGQGAGFRITLRVMDENRDFSPWFFMGEGGAWRKQDDEVTQDEAWGRVKIDYLALKETAHAFQYKIDFIAPGDEVAPESSELHRFFVHYSGIAKRNCKHLRPPNYEFVRIPIPYRSQLDVEREELRHIVCCPTCVAMVLESIGVDRPTLDICDAAYDPRHQIYGIWPRAAQAAFLNGKKAWVQRFRHMNGVRACLMAGRPIIASIRVAEGELRGARYPQSNGHLIVVKGLTDYGKILVNDPYSAGPQGGEIEYEIEDIEKVWLDCGGVGIMIE